jgi:hypothetical protein
MKTFLALALAGLAILTSGSVNAREIRTTFSFIVTIDDRVWPYNDNMSADVDVILPEGSRWRCVRRRLSLPQDGAARGAIDCSSDGGKTNVIVSASCGLVSEDHHNSATLGAGSSVVTITANCNTSVYWTDWLGF